MKKICILTIVFIGLFMETHAQLIDWDRLSNPIYSYKDWSVKDACMIYNEADSSFYVFFSAFYFDNGQVRSHVVGVKSRDLITFSEPLFIWDGQSEGWIGMCSPNINKVGDRYILTYNSWGDKKRKPNQLFYAESTDLNAWNKHLPLARNITKGVRAIDAAIIPHNGQYLLTWKRIQTAQVSVSDSLGANRWLNLGGLNLGWFENAQFIAIEGHLHMICTVVDKAQKIYKMKNQGGDIWNYTTWDFVAEIKVPEEAFNTNERMNAGFLFDNTAIDGYYYYIYAGRTENKSQLGRGDNKLGITRSKDLQTWSVPE